MYKPVDPEFWEGRTDKEDGDAGIRWHDVIECVDIQKDEIPTLNTQQSGIALIGFCSDEGVKRNRGRAGAAGGPAAIRKACANFACHFDPKSTFFIDCGDIFFEGTCLGVIQVELAATVKSLVGKNYFPIILGGGHEVSVGGYKGVLETFTENVPSIGILNFDAHFDLRNPATQISSGTPFMQLAELCQKHEKEFNYMVMGIQQQSNTEALFRRANELSVKYVLGEDITESNMPNIEHVLINFLNKTDACYLSIDMDVFDISDAPGVSAPSVPGVDKRMLFRILKTVLASNKLVACDIAETNPVYDIDKRTAKLAAWLVYQLVSRLTA